MAKIQNVLHFSFSRDNASAEKIYDDTDSVWRINATKATHNWLVHLGLVIAIAMNLLYIVKVIKQNVRSNHCRWCCNYRECAGIHTLSHYNNVCMRILLPFIVDIAKLLRSEMAFADVRVFWILSFELAMCSAYWMVCIRYARDCIVNNHNVYLWMISDSINFGFNINFFFSHKQSLWSIRHGQDEYWINWFLFCAIFFLLFFQPQAFSFTIMKLIRLLFFRGH